MKIFYRILILAAFFLMSSTIYSQITVVNAIAVDGDNNGYYGTVEIEFSTGVDDSDLNQAGERDDWEFSLDPTFTTGVLSPNAFNTTVSFIASGIPDHNDDKYIQFTFGSEFASSIGPIYYRYTEDGGVTDVTEAFTLASFAIKAAGDSSAPAINNVTASTSGGSILKVGDEVDFTIELKAEEYGITISPTTFNTGALSWSTVDGINYTSTYTVEEGDPELTDIQLTAITVEDTDGNVSAVSSSNTLTNDIDSNTPGISSVGVVETGSGISIVEDTITFTINLTTPESGLTVSPTTYNGRSLNWDDSDPAAYVGKYPVTEGDDDQEVALDLLNITLTDAAGNVSNSEDGIVTLGIDANTPSITDVTASTSGGSVLKVGDEVDFVVTVSDAEYGLTVSPTTFNTETLTWSTTNGLTYTSTYTVAETDPELTSIQLTGVTLIDASGNTSSSDASNTLSNDIDSNTPGISSVDVVETGSGISIVEDTITFTINLTTPESGLTVSPTTYNGRSLNWDDSDAAAYVGKYPVTEGDDDQEVALDLFDITLTDAAGNVSNSEVGDVTLGIDANTPVIVDVTSNATGAGTLGIGDQITFTVDVQTKDGSLTVQPLNYNGQPLNWYTNNGGDTYIGVYTVTEGDADQGSPLDLTGVTLTDFAGNVSGSADGSDVAKTIDANSPVITSVELKSKSKKIGDEDTLHITITADTDFNSYTLVSGTVAGYTIKAIDPENSTTIYALFDITERSYDIDSAETVLVSNLQLSDGSNVSNTINTSVNNDTHAIFSKKPTAQISGSKTLCNKDSTEVPIVLSGHAPFTVTYTDGFTPVVINSITTSPYMLKIIADESIGDPLTYTITNVTDATGNSNAGSGSFNLDINSLPNAYFTSPTNGDNFDISYDTIDLVATPVGGEFSGTGVFSTTDQFSPSLAGKGFHDLHYDYEDANGCKDADTITIEVIEGGTISFSQSKTTYCSYTDTFTVTGFNNFGDPGSFTLVGDPGGALVNIAVDTALIRPDLLDGNQSYTLKYSYASGEDISASFYVEEVSSSITFSSVGNHCEDYTIIEAEAKNLSPLGGTGYFVLSDAGVNLNPYNNGNNIYINAGDIVPGSYDLEYHYVTSDGCSSDTITEAFEIYSLPTVSFAPGTETVYNIDQGAILITGDPADAGGVFTSTLDFIDDNNNGTANIDPESIDLGFQDIYYTYTDANGCVNKDTLEIEVREALGTIASALGSFQYCYYGAVVDTLTGTPDPTDGSAGSFYIDDNLITPYADNKIILNPQDYLDGDHMIRYDYSDGSTSYSVYQSFNIDSIGDISFAGLADNYCEDEGIEVELTATYFGDPGTMEFSGNGVSDLFEDEYGYFYPNLANVGENSITYTFTRNYSGCQKEYSETTIVNKTPNINFSANQRCISNAEELVGFTADTLSTDSVVNWAWTFLGVTYTSESPALKTGIGSKSIKLELETNKGCTSDLEKDFYVGTKVDLEFTFENECDGETVLFNLLETTDEFDLDSARWSFGGSGISNITDLRKPTHLYDAPGAYDVIYEEFTNSCGRIADTVRINIRPSVDLSTTYLEDFEEDPDITGWVIEDFIEGAANTWEWGEPLGTLINSAASGTNAFVTNLDGNYASNEKSMITSPCFDFSSMERPMMKMDYIVYTEADRDGAVMQYSRDGDWVTIGVPSDGINWYNSYIISGSPAGQQLGWTGELVNLDNNGWKTAMFRLDELRGRSGVRFRLVFGSNGDFTDEGFAFDNIQFKERERLVLLENFTNINDEDANDAQDEIIDPIISKDSVDVISLNYHTSFPSSNDFNSFYPSGPSARTLYYGVSEVPYAVVDGQGEFDFSLGNELAESDIHKRVLIDPTFEISLKQAIQGENLVVSAYIKSLEDITGKDFVTYIAVVEDTVVEGSIEYYNVLRDMLPDAAGTLIERDWLAGDSVNIYQKRNIPEGVNQENITTIVFIQDEETKEVYQTAFTTDFATITSVDEMEEAIAEYDYRVYPNPVKDVLTIELLKNVSYDIEVNVYNNIGALVKSNKLIRGENLIEFNTNNLPGGIYYIRLSSSEKIIDSKKIIKID